MAEKRRATTFRTSKGTVVNVQYPDIYISPAFLSTEDVTNPTEMMEVLSEALRGGLDVHDSFHWNKYLEDGLDAHFLCSLDFGSPRVTELAKVSDYWKPPSPFDPTVDGSLTCPLTVGEVEITSRKSFRYPLVNFQTKLPNLTIDAVTIEFGFEVMSSHGTGTAQFWFERAGGADILYAYIGSGGTYRQTIITYALPVTYKTVRSNYSVKVSRGKSEFYIDRVLRAVGVHAPTVFNIVGPPYNVFSHDLPMTPIMPCQVEVSGQKLQALTFPLNPMLVTVGDSDPNPPQNLRLYQTGTNIILNGLVLAAGSVTSHPIVALPHRTKTIYFRANTNGTLLVEIYMQSGNWRTYDTVNISANTLHSYVMTGEAVLVRVTFTPASYPSTISDAEAILSGDGE